MSRSLWKPFYNLLNKSSDDTLIMSHFIRRGRVLPEHVKLKVTIYNGRKESNIRITPKMVGYKFGQLYLTKKRVVHQIKKKKKK